MIDPRLISTIIFMPLIGLIFVQDAKKYEHRYDHIHDETGHYIKHINATYFFHITIDETDKPTSLTISKRINHRINHDHHTNYMFFELYRYNYCDHLYSRYNLANIFKSKHELNQTYTQCMQGYIKNLLFHESLLYKK